MSMHDWSAPLTVRHHIFETAYDAYEHQRTDPRRHDLAKIPLLESEFAATNFIRSMPYQLVSLPDIKLCTTTTLCGFLK